MIIVNDLIMPRGPSGVGNRWVFRRGAFILITVKSSTKLMAELFRTRI